MANKKDLKSSMAHGMSSGLDSLTTTDHKNTGARTATKGEGCTLVTL